MRHSLTIALCLSLGVIACNRKPALKPALKFSSEEVLHEDSQGALTVITCYTEGVVGLPVWQVCYRAASAHEATPLFTVERVWQESEPGFPVFDDVSGETEIHDQACSYVYSFRQRAFTHNAQPYSVYVGSYQR